jgi:replicative DNA helicase Mcm
LEYSEAKVKDIFVDFLKSYKDELGELKYRIEISELPAKASKSVIVDYPDLERFDTDLSTSLVKAPEQFLDAFDRAAVETLNVENPIYADSAGKEIRVRIRDLPDRISLRGVTKNQLNTLILVAGMVTRTSELRPLAINAAFRCSNLHTTFVHQNGSGVILKRPIKCETEGCGETKNFELDDLQTEFLDFQVIRIQEMPEELPPGQLPQSFDVNLTGDIVNSARPGDRIYLTGVVKAESENIGGYSRKLFNQRIEANFVEQVSRRPEDQTVSRDEEETIKGIASTPGAYDRLVASVAPAIYGHELHKEAALLLMVGSPQKVLPDGSTLRGDINVLLVGDPGTAKSELLKYVSRVAPRGLFTSGRGSTAAGLTAAVVKEKNGMMMLEAGATVLADLGVACIDEFDKLRDEDRSALHEVMEQQTCCYDEITEILTEGGWRKFPELRPEDKVATLNDGKLEYQKPSAYFSYDYKGDMFAIRSRQVDLFVTPNHSLFVNINKRADEWGGFRIITASGLPPRKRMRFKKDATWTGSSPDDFVVPGIVKYTNQARNGIVVDPVFIPMKLWVEFLGYYISKGGTQKHPRTGVPYRVHITQKKKEGMQAIDACLRKLPFKFSYDGHNFTINSKQLASCLYSIGRTHAKHIPEDIKQLSPKLLQILLDALLAGDGHVSKRTGSVYYTSSKQLADDVTELALKVGLAANVYCRLSPITLPRMYNYGKQGVLEFRDTKPTSEIYEVCLLRKRQTQPNVNANGYDQISKIPFSGRVFCVEVPNHLVYVRRNGKPAWCGNSVAKGGIIATLNARTSIFAAANPENGKYDAYKNILENVTLPIPLLTRFDLIFIIRDQPDQAEDETVARHILDLRAKSSFPTAPPIEFEVLKKYIVYAKKLDPELTEEARTRLSGYYIKLRREASPDQISVTPRWLEGMIRLSIARARLLLHPRVTEDDALHSINLIDRMLKTVAVDTATKKTDVGVLYNRPLSEKGLREAALDVFKRLSGDTKQPVEDKKFYEEMEKDGKFSRDQAEKVFQDMWKSGVIYEVRAHHFKKT